MYLISDTSIHIRQQSSMPQYLTNTNSISMVNLAEIYDVINYLYSLEDQGKP